MLIHYIISDLHLADGSRRDDFKKNRAEFKKFLRMVEKQKAQLIIAGDFSEYLTGAKKLLKKYDYVILGHTHKPGTAFEERYLNSGSWTSKKPTYVEVNHHGHCTLKYWPTQNPVKKTFNLTEPKPI